MEKTILYKLFRVGRIPPKLRAVFDAEGLVAMDEGIRGHVRMSDFKSPGKRFKAKRAGFTGFLAVTRKRVAAYAYGKRLINVPFSHAHFALLKTELLDSRSLQLSFDTSEFDDAHSGRIVIVFHTTQAEALHRAMNTA